MRRQQAVQLAGLLRFAAAPGAHPLWGARFVRLVCAGRRRSLNLPRFRGPLHLIEIEFNAPVQPAGTPRQVRPSQGRRRSGGAQSGGCSCVTYAVLCCAVLCCTVLPANLCSMGCAVPAPGCRWPGPTVGRLLSPISVSACCASACCVSASDQHPSHALLQAWDTLNNPIKKRAYDAYGGCFHLVASAP